MCQSNEPKLSMSVLSTPVDMNCTIFVKVDSESQLGGKRRDMTVANAIGFPMMFLSGSFFPLEMMPGFLRVVAKGIPLTYMTNALRDTMLFGNNISALANLAVLVAFGTVLFVAGSRLMSWKEK